MKEGCGWQNGMKLSLRCRVTHLSATQRWSDLSLEKPRRENAELLPWPARSPDLSPIENMWSMVAQRLTQITPPAATPDQLWQRVEAAWCETCCTPRTHPKSL
ncbi:transposable element Tcb1 transposase [Trichonephila clavipes]|nr:transposable element Tcb1 transposase [Trichonephila clavipes]